MAMAMKAWKEGGTDDSILPDNLEETIRELNELIAQSRTHINMHTGQQEQYNNFFELATKCIAGTASKEKIEETINFLVLDMAQNGATLTLNLDQASDFYYMSPLTHLIFGVCKPARDFLNAYIWEEGTAD